MGPSDRPTLGLIEKQISTWLENDDIFEPQFMAGAVFVIEGNHQKLNLSASIESLPRHLKPNWWVSLTSHSSDELQPGPRMVSNGKLFTVSRVHDDVQNAFMVATMPRTSLGFVNLNPYKKKDREWETRLTAHRPFANLHASGNFYTSLGVAVLRVSQGFMQKTNPSEVSGLP